MSDVFEKQKDEDREEAEADEVIVSNHSRLSSIWPFISLTLKHLMIISFFFCFNISSNRMNKAKPVYYDRQSCV